MLRGDEIVADVLLTAELFTKNDADLSAVLSVRDPVFWQWKAHEASRNLQKLWSPRRVMPPRLSTSIHYTHLWQKSQRRWRRMMRLYSQMFSWSDPALVFYKKQSKKMIRQFESAQTEDQQARAFDAWLELESGFWDGFMRLGFGDEPAMPPPRIDIPQQAEFETDSVGVYNKALNTLQLRQWFHRALPNAAPEWEVIWASYRSYWKEQALFQASLAHQPELSHEEK